MQKQVLAVFVGVVIALLLGVFVYMQFSDRDQSASHKETTPSTKHTTSSDLMVRQATTPDTIDGIAESISAESDMDMAALEAEAAGETSSLDTEESGINNLENAYDENSL